jgi:hypothetical protein
MILQKLAEPFYVSYDEDLTKRNAGPNIIKNNFMNTKIKKKRISIKDDEEEDIVNAPASLNNGGSIIIYPMKKN